MPGGAKRWGRDLGGEKDGGEGENESDAFMGIGVRGGLGCKVRFFFSKS